MSSRVLIGFFDQREQPDVSAFLEGAFRFVETKDCVGEYFGSCVDGKPHGSGTLLLSPHLDDVYKGTFRHLTQPD